MQAAMLPKEIGSLKEMELVCWKAFNAFCELHSPQDLKLFKFLNLKLTLTYTEFYWGDQSFKCLCCSEVGV